MGQSMAWRQNGKPPILWFWCNKGQQRRKGKRLHFPGCFPSCILQNQQITLARARKAGDEQKLPLSFRKMKRRNAAPAPPWYKQPGVSNSSDRSTSEQAFQSHNWAVWLQASESICVKILCMPLRLWCVKVLSLQLPASLSKNYGFQMSALLVSRCPWMIPEKNQEGVALPLLLYGFAHRGPWLT